MAFCKGWLSAPEVGAFDDPDWTCLRCVFQALKEERRSMGLMRARDLGGTNRRGHATQHAWLREHCAPGLRAAVRRREAGCGHPKRYGRRAPSGEVLAEPPG